MPDFILASTSPTRAAMLRGAGISFQTEKPGVDEAALKRTMPGVHPAQVAMALAEAKAADVAGRRPGAVVLGADQVLNFDGRIYDKPATIAEARAHLLELRGKSHRLETAAALVRDGEILWRGQEFAELHMRAASDTFIESYIAAEGSDLLASVGGYKIEGRGVQLFSRVTGDHFVILGLPLLGLCEALREHGMLLP